MAGDDVIGPENLRRYFEQRFHDHNDSYVLFPLVYIDSCDLSAEEYDSMRYSTSCVCIMYARNTLRPARCDPSRQLFSGLNMCISAFARGDRSRTYEW